MCTQPRVHMTLNKKLMAAGSDDCIPHDRSYKPFFGGPGRGTSMPTSLVCRRMMMVGPTLCCGDLEISPAFSTQHTWDRVAPGALGHVCCDCQWHHKQSKMGGKRFPFFNSSSAYERTSPRVRRCSVTGSAGLSFHVVNRWPGPPS